MKKLITMCAVVGLMLSAASVSWAVPTVTPPPDAPDWWNFACYYYAYAWWEEDLTLDGSDTWPTDDYDHWDSNFLYNTDFTASVDGNTVSIYLDNEYRPNYYKEIYIYLDGTTTSTDEDIYSTLSTDDGVFSGWFGGSIGDGEWSYLVEGDIEPQPDYVLLTVTVPGLTGVTNIWAGENCIPEPATLLLLGLGGLALLRNRRK